MRADRLLALLLLLQARGTLTAAQAAAELEVSERTARRDLEALAVSGVPVYSRHGRGGGWSLLGGARTDLSGLTEPEARALVLAAAPSRSASDGEALRAAIRKLTQALPETFREQAQAAAGAVLVDPSAWGGSAAPVPPALGAVQEATVRGRVLAFTYGRPGSPPTSRRAHPLGLVTKGAYWYLMALTDDGRRTYRVDRIQSVTVTDEVARRPADFDLRRAWQEVESTVAGFRTPATVTVDATRMGVSMLRVVFGDDLTVLGEDRSAHQAGEGDPAIRCVVGGRASWQIAMRLAGLVDQVTVVDPPEARAELVRLAGALAERYRGIPPGPDPWVEFEEVGDRRPR